MNGCSPLLLTVCYLLFASAPLTAAQDVKKEAKRPSPWERLRARILVKDAEYAGNETCGQAKCHADTVKTWTQLAHSQHVLKAKDWMEDERSCEGCHGPGSEHATDRQNGSIAKLSEHPDYVAALCNRCHHQDIKSNHFLATVHANAKMSCGTCHDVHRDHQSVHLLRGTAAGFGFWVFGSGRKGQPQNPEPRTQNLPASQPPRKDRGALTGFISASLTEFVNPQFATDRQKISALCLSCHPKQRGELHQNSRHPVFDGRMTCTDCHNPHRSEETMRFTRRADDQCTRCHTDKRGPFVFAHDVTSVGEGCQTCHAPHGSPNNKLTKLNGRGLCLQCHSDVAADPQHQLRPGNCWSAGCHADFHGSQTSSVFIATGARALQSRVLRSPSQRDFGFGNYPSAIRHPPSAILAWLAATPSEEKEKKEALPPKQYEVEATGSYQTLGVDGNLSKYHQYNVKPDAFFSDSLRLKLFDKTGFGFGSLRWTGVDEPTQTFALWLDGLAPTRTTLRYDYDRASFFIEPSLDRVTVSERRNQNFLLRLLPSDKTPALDLIGQSQRVNAPGLSRLRSGGVPGSLNYRTTSVGPQLRVPVGSGLFGFGFTHESFTDNTQFLPGASSNVWQFRYDGDIGAKTSAFASFNNALIQQSGLLGTSAVRQTQVGAVSTPTRHLTVSALLSFDDIDMPNTFNAFVTDNDALTLCVRYRPKARLLLEGGYEHSAVKRVNATHTFIDASRWDGGWLVLRAAPAPHVNFLLKHVRRRLDDPPPANVLGLATTSSLFFDEDDRTDAQLTFMLPRDAILYTSYHRTKRDNDARDVGFRLNSWNAGLSAPLSAKLSMNVDWNRQRWSGRGDVLMNDPLLLNFGRPLTSDGNYINLGLAYATGKATWTTHLYRFRSSGGESVRGRGIGIGYERPLFKQCAARLQVGWDDYEDRFLPGFDNSDSFIRLDLLRRF